MSEPTVGDVFDRALPRIKSLRQRYFEGEIARWLLGEVGHGPDGEPFEYPCRRCGRFHFVESGIGRRHRLPSEKRR